MTAETQDAEPTAAQILEEAFPVDPGQVEIAEETTLETPTPAPADPVSPPPPPKPALPGYLVKAARRLGIDDVEIASMDQPTLERAVDLLAKATGPDMRQRDEKGRFVASTEAQQQQQQQPEPEEFNLSQIGVDTSKWDDNMPVEKMFADVTRPLLQKIRGLEQSLEAIVGSVRQREAAANLDRLDQLFASKAAIYGEGSRQKLDRSSPEFIRRATVAKAMQEFAKANPGMSLDAVFDRVNSTIFGMLEASKPAPDPKGFAQGATMKPGSRVEPPKQKGVRTAVESVEKKLQEIAVKTAGDTSEHDELPD